MKKRIFQFIGVILLMFINKVALLAQKPREIQVDNNPPDFSDTATLIVLIIIPILLIVAYFFLRKRWKK